ncbi:MAG: hypothetical protein WDZ37_02015 [Solirubrobacterales bacterium]
MQVHHSRLWPVALLALVLAVLVWPSSAQASLRGCGKISMDFTKAGVRAKLVTCDKARHVGRIWRRMSYDCDFMCTVLHVEGFRCVFDPSGPAILRVSCARDAKRVKLSWGD